MEKRQAYRRSLLFCVAAFASVALINAADARCVNTTTGGQVTDGADAPASGQAVVCNAAAPNPHTTVISAVDPSTGVSVTVQSGAIVRTSLRAIGVFNASTVLNQGQVSTIGGNNAFGMSTTGAGSMLINEGLVTTTGTAGNGLNAQGTNSTLINKGTISVSGNNANGIRSTETTAGTTITNSGSISTTGPGTSNGVLMAAGTLTNEIGGTISGQAAGVSITRAGNVANAGTITGVTGSAIIANGAFANALTNSGIINGSVDLGDGNDTLTWQDGGKITDAITLGSGNDLATLRDLTAANLTMPVLDGGSGMDQLTFDNVITAGVARFQNWELIELTNGSELTFASTLTLGDSGTGTGTLTIDSTSTVFAGDGSHAIVPFTDGQRVTVINAGTIDLTNGPAGANDSLTITGDYVGQNADLLLQTVLAGDGAPSDKLVISRGSASGSTNIGVTNLGGNGALTTTNGILVVDAIDGGTTASGAFSLTQALAAGPFEYLLYRGGVTAGTEQNWYLRSSAPPSGRNAPQPAQPAPPSPASTTVASVPPTLPPPPGPPRPGTPVIQTAAGPVVPFYRVEVPLYSILPATARHLGLSALGTFHDRQGDQALLRGNGVLPGTWARVFGAQNDQSFDGTVLPEFDGNIWGVQAGQDLLGIDRPGGGRDRFGLFYAFSQADADIRGFVVGQLSKRAGKVDLEGNSLGGYWTHIGSTGWYLDGVLMNTWLNGDTRSVRRLGTKADGNAFTASLEGGYPISLERSWTVEPQAQIVWQDVSFDATQDVFSSIVYEDSDAVAGRLGMRLHGVVQAGRKLLRPYLKANLWHTFSGTDTVVLARTPIGAEQETTALELGGGLVAQVTEAIALYGSASYATDIDDLHQETVSGNVGMRVTW